MIRSLISEVRSIPEGLRIVGGELGVRQRQREVEFELQGPGSVTRFYFRSPEPILEPSNEAFLASALLPAMKMGVDLNLDGPISARLLSAVPTLLDIYENFEPALQRISVSGPVPVERTRAPVGRVGCFFSGGLDSFYSLVKHRAEITDVIFVHGFDIPLEDEERWSRAAASVEAAASELGVHVVHVKTNFRVTTRPFTNWILGHGAGIAAIAELLAPGFDRIYIPSTGCYTQLARTGTHPLLDPLWSTESLEIVHDGCEANRVKKTLFIADCDTALRYLRVCPKGLGGTYNCGHCEKCVRTMLNLAIAERLEECGTFDRPLDARSIRRQIMRSSNRGFYEESLEALEKLGLRPDLQRALKYILLRPDWLNARNVKLLLRRALPKRLRPPRPPR